MKARTIICAGSFAQAAIAALGVTAAALGLLTAASALIEAVCCGLASERGD